jgi:hypothetical protein
MSKMVHGLILIGTFIITVVIVLIIYRPDIVEKWWLWAIGLAAPAVGWYRAIKEKIDERIADFKKSKPSQK